MAKRTTKRRIGGKAIASGSDGCVFDKKFDSSGNPIETSDTISKVFANSKKNVAEQEFSVQERIKSITGGVGVVVSKTRIINIIPEVKDSIPPELLKAEGCRSLDKDQKEKKTPQYAIEYPRIVGDMIKTPSQPLKFFEKAVRALDLLSKGGIVHLDIAARNIFVIENPDKTQEAAIGDFGTAVDMRDPRYLDLVKSRVTDITGGHIGNVLGSDQITPFFGIAALMFFDKENSEKINEHKDSITNLLKEYPKKDGGIEYDFEGGWLNKSAYNTPILQSTVVPNLAQFMKLYLTLPKTEYERIFKMELGMTDETMLELLMSRKSTQPVDGSLWNNTVRQLKGRLKSLRLGGKRKTRRRPTSKAKH